MDFTQNVNDLYAAFQRGDIAFILGRLDENVQWEQWENNTAQAARVPWLAPRKGPAAVADFFRVIGQMKFHEFRVLSVLGGGNEVAGVIAIDAELPGGARLRDEEIHLFTFNAAGKVVRFRHYLDTAKHIEAAGKTTFA
jgi:ketosteroid isomerase-like protein